jgi:cytochrome c oxidase assembly protein subunit 15
VSHIRLALHLSIAFTIFALLLWAILDVISVQKPNKMHKNNTLACLYCGWVAVLCVQVILGAFMAGLHAGLIYNTWPTMNGQWIPDGLISTTAWYSNLTLIQFLHRKTAVFLMVTFVLLWFLYRNYVRNNQLYKAFWAVAVVLVVQFILGVLTLLNMAPLDLALTHQMTALFLFAVAVKLLHTLVRSQ